MYNTEDSFKVFFGNSNPSFNEKFCSYIRASCLGKLTVGRFSDGEVRVEIDDFVDSVETYVVQSLCCPVNDNLMELLFISDALRRLNARKITAVIPYFGYSRQDRQTGNTPISAKVVANMLEMSGVDRLITMDLHSSQIGGFFDIPVSSLSFSTVIYEYIKKNFDVKKTVIVSPDAGGFRKALKLSEILGCDIAFINKSRPAHNEVLASSLVGNVHDKCVVIQDDMVDTAGTLVESVKIIKDYSPKSITVFCTHPVLSGDSFEKISNSAIDKLIISDTISIGTKFIEILKIEIISVAEMFASQLKSK